MRYRLGIDTGGTFTDLTLFCERTGQIWSLKVPSTPEEPSEAIFNGITQMKDFAGINIEDIHYLGHGTTVATNILIQLKGAKAGLITTGGFRDLLEIGRQRRPELYEFYADKPPVLIPKDLRKEVSERMLSDGQVLRGLKDKELIQIIKQLLDENVEAVAVCFLHSYINPSHELEVKKALKKIDSKTHVYLSSEVLPEFREYERLSTTVLCAYLGPVVGNYTEMLQRRAKDIGLRSDPYITQSNGGIMSCLSVREKPIETALSGPASGVVASCYLGSVVDIKNLITLDMGGTSADVCLIENGVARVTTEKSIVGYPVKNPMIDVDSIGAGGGSIAWIDEGGALKVGPKSAGADPGPACYGKGGDEPTVTDANLVLGRINPEYFLGGRMKIYPELSHIAIQKRVCEKLGMDLVKAAVGIITVVNSHMIRAIRRISIERGYDPREFTLLAFGGAGPLHAVAVAEELGIEKVVVPRSPGTFSSLGLLVAEFRSDFVRTNIVVGEKRSIGTVNRIFSELDSLALEWLYQEKVPKSKMLLRRSVDMRYYRQNYEHRVEMKDKRMSRFNIDELLASFHREHQKDHGYSIRDSPVEFVNFRVTAHGMIPKAKLTAYKVNGYDTERALRGYRKVYFDSKKRFMDCPIYEMEKLAFQNQIKGPAIIEQLGSTIIIPPLQRALVDKYKNVVIQINRGSE